MKALKCTLIALLALLPFATGTALAEEENGYSRMFVFGASFLDPGNHFAVTGETAHPPFDPTSLASYGIGGHHYSNGRTWVEVLAQEMNLTNWAKPAYRDPAFGNYAYGYARAREVEYPVGPSLGDQVQAWIGNGFCTGLAMNDTLFVLDTGYADMLDILYGDDPVDVVLGMLESIATNIYILHQCGARNLLVANLPPLGVAPGVPDAEKPLATGVSHQYNLYVQDMLGDFAGAPFNMNISTFDAFTFVTELIEMREDYGFTNVEDACLTFGVLKDAYCKDRDGYLFWDPLHPSKKAHALMGKEAFRQLPALD